MGEGGGRARLLQARLGSARPGAALQGLPLADSRSHHFAHGSRQAAAGGAGCPAAERGQEAGEEAGRPAGGRQPPAAHRGSARRSAWQRERSRPRRSVLPGSGHFLCNCPPGARGAHGQVWICRREGRGNFFPHPSPSLRFLCSRSHLPHMQSGALAVGFRAPVGVLICERRAALPLRVLSLYINLSYEEP